MQRYCCSTLCETVSYRLHTINQTKIQSLQYMPTFCFAHEDVHLSNQLSGSPMLSIHKEYEKLQYHKTVCFFAGRLDLCISCRQSKYLHLNIKLRIIKKVTPSKTEMLNTGYSRRQRRTGLTAYGKLSPWFCQYSVGVTLLAASPGHYQTVCFSFFFVYFWFSLRVLD